MYGGQTDPFCIPFTIFLVFMGVVVSSRKPRQDRTSDRIGIRHGIHIHLVLYAFTHLCRSG